MRALLVGILNFVPARILVATLDNRPEISSSCLSNIVFAWLKLDYRSTVRSVRVVASCSLDDCICSEGQPQLLEDILVGTTS